jgi:hypothetical protein
LERHSSDHWGKKIFISPHILEDITTGWFDGATQRNGNISGAGGLIRLNKHNIYRWTFNCGPGTNTRVELLGAWATLHLASRLNIEQLQLIGDSKVIIDWLNQSGTLHSIALLAWMDQIRSLQRLLRNSSSLMPPVNTMGKQPAIKDSTRKNNRPDYFQPMAGWP